MIVTKNEPSDIKRNNSKCIIFHEPMIRSLTEFDNGSKIFLVTIRNKIIFGTK